MKTLAPVVLVCSLAGSLHAGSIADALFQFSMQFPAVTTNQFGYSGPLPSLPPPTTNQTGDGIIDAADPSTFQTLQIEPRIIQATSGSLIVQSVTFGTASASETGDISGNLANLTSAPLTVTFSLADGAIVGTDVSNDYDLASAYVFADFQIGGWSATYQQTSNQNGPPQTSGFTGGNVQITIPASSVVPYQIEWAVGTDVSSICGVTCAPPPVSNPPSDPPVPEPGTLLMLGSGVAGLIWKMRRSTLGL